MKVLNWPEYLKSKVKLEDGCWLWQGARMGGSSAYGKVRQGSLKPKFVHRVSYEVFKGSLNANLMVLHTCNTPLCINPEHLYQGTQTDNMHDRKAAGNYSMQRNKQ
jgi:hypothetical protein